MNPVAILQMAKGLSKAVYFSYLVKTENGFAGTITWEGLEEAEAKYLWELTRSSFMPGLTADADSRKIQVTGDSYKFSVDFEPVVIVPQVTVSIDQEDPLNLFTGDSEYALTATVLNVPQGESDAVTWASDDATVVTVDPASGLVTIVDVGTTTITATSVYDELISDFITVVVSPPN